MNSVNVINQCEIIKQTGIDPFHHKKRYISTMYAKKEDSMLGTVQVFFFFIKMFKPVLFSNTKQVFTDIALQHAILKVLH